MTDDTIPLFAFPAVQGKKITAAFDGGRMSSDGGVMLLCLAERRLGVGGRAYLHIVESRREGATVRQQVIATLGRIEDLQASGQLERLLRSGARFADKAIVLDALDRGQAATIATRRVGPSLAFKRVWEQTGCRDVIERLARARKHDFSLERAAFLTVLHRLVYGGSDRAADRWREDYHIDGVEGLELHHLYRTMAWLGEELPKTSGTPRRRLRRAA